MTRKIRYQSLDYDGHVLREGQTIQSVEGAGKRLIIDYRDLRHAHQGHYPPSVLTWKRGINIGDVLRAAANIHREESGCTH